MSAHTPGPWTAESEIDLNGNELNKLWIIMRGQPTAYGFDRIEDARLAAAAPDLLEALLLVMPLAKGYAPSGQTAIARQTCDKWIAAAEAAIARATGAA